MRPALFRTLATIVLATALPACGAPREAAPRSRVDRGPSPDPARDPLGARLHADVVAHAGEMEEVGEITRGTLRENASDERTVVLHGGYCYAIFVEASPSAGDVSLRLVDANGDPVQLDRERGPSATLGRAEALCPASAGEFRLEVRAEHPGAYAMRTFRAQAI